MFASRSVKLLGFVIAIALFGILVVAYFPGNQIAAEEASIDDPRSISSSGFGTNSIILGNPSPSPTPELEHWHVAAYYDLENFPSAKFLLNNKDIVAREVRVTLYSLEGLALEVPPVSIGATSAVMIDLAEWAKLSGEDFSRGSIKIFHTGKDRVIGSQVYLENTASGLSFEERLAELGKFDSRRLEGIWYMPRNQTDVTIILSNTSDQLLTVNAKLSKNPRQSGITEPFVLLPHQTRVLDLKTDFQDGADFALGRVVGLSLTHNGGNSDLKAHGLVSDPEKGYSNTIQFTNPDKAKSSEFHGTGLHLGQFGGEELTPVVIVKNVGAILTNVSAKVNYTRIDGTTGSISLESVAFRTGEMRPLNMDAVIHRAQKEQIEIAGIEVTSDTAPGSIIVSTQSIGAGLDQVFRVPMYDPYAQTSSTGGYPWRIDATSSTYAYIKNTTSEEQEYVSYLTWEGTEYMIGLKKIAPGQTIQIDVKKLRDQQIPDERGSLIPQNLTEGQLQWTIRSDRFDESEPLKKFKLVGRSEQIDIVNKTSSSYACQNCCQMWYEGIISSGGITEVEIGDQIQFVAYERVTTCNGLPSGFYLIGTPGAAWTSSNDNIATVSNSGLVTVVGVGEFEIDGAWKRDNTSTQGGYCPGPYLTGGSVGKPKSGSTQNMLPDCTSCDTEITRLGSNIDLVANPKVTITKADGSALSNPHRIGINGGGNNRKQPLVATVTPPEEAPNVTIEVSSKITLSNVQRFSGGIITFDVVGNSQSSSSSGSCNNGDSFIKAIHSSAALANKPALVVVSSKVATPHDTTGTYVAANRVLDAGTSPAYQGLPTGQVALTTIFARFLTITVKDQCNNLVGDIYAGAIVTETVGASNVSINQPLTSASTYSDPVGGLRTFSIVPRGSAAALGWPEQPLQPMVSQSEIQYIPVQVDGFTLVPGIVERTWTTTPPNTLTITWPN